AGERGGKDQADQRVLRRGPGDREHLAELADGPDAGPDGRGLTTLRPLPPTAHPPPPPRPASLPSFDLPPRVNFAALDNALNNTRKAIAARFDFRGVAAELTLDRKEKTLKIVTEDGTKHKGIREMFESAANKRGLALKTFVWGEPEPGLAGK